MKMKFKLALPVFLSALLVAGCGNNSKDLDSPTMGNIKISVDETFKPIIDTERDTFQSIYEYAKIRVDYKAENDVFNDLLTDSVHLIITARKLTKEDSAHFERIKIVPQVRRFAYDAVAVIVNKENRDTNLTMQNFRDIMSGKVTSWKQINGGSGLAGIQIVFDNTNSGTVRYVREKINNLPLAKNSYAQKDNPSVVDYVSKNKNAIGVIGVNWISDKHDTVTHNFMRKINVVGLASDTSKEFYQPYQAYIAQRVYPLVRELYIIDGEGRAGLGSGFMAFICSDRGQRIILKSGLVPATAPVRLVELNPENLRITK